MDNFFQDEFKVNMGQKKEMTRDQLLAQNKQERIEREIVRKNSNAALQIQRVLRSYVSNKNLFKFIFADENNKLQQTIMIFKAATVKSPAQKDAIFIKGIGKVQNDVVAGFNALLLTLGSVDSSAKCQRDPRQYTLFPRKLNQYSRVLSDLIYLFVEQHRHSDPQIGKQNLDKFVSLRLTLIKTVLRFLALMMNSNQTDMGFLAQGLTFLQQETVFQPNLWNQVLENEKFPAFNYYNKLSVKIIMVLTIEKSCQYKLSTNENSLLNVMRQVICSTGILDSQLDQVEQQFSTDSNTIVTSNQINEMLLVTVTDKSLHQERELNQQLMQLALVDVVSGMNSDLAQSYLIRHIMNSNRSFKLVSLVMKMSSPSFLKPYQLQTVMCYAETQYHSNDYSFMQIMADVLSVSKNQIKEWKQERISKQFEAEESKTGLYTYKYTETTKNVKASFVDISEKMGRDKFSSMIGEKVIGKVFNDNLKDFKSEEDMEPILRICQIITKVLNILKELDIKQRAQIESQVLYRSNILMILHHYISKQYPVSSFSMENFNDLGLVKQIKRDEEFLDLFCFIISKRLIVIDDIEFKGENKTKTFPFIPFQETRFVSYLLNNMAYRIFLSPRAMSYFSEEFLQNIKKAITRLYERDKRLKINGENFWIVDKFISEKLDNASHDEVSQAINTTILVNVPHTIPFRLRAKIFQNLIKMQQEHFNGWHPITISRQYILENSYDKIFKQKVNLKRKLQIKFMNEHGQIEEGIDGGGLFKEFITKLCDKIFDPEYAYFKENEKDRKLLPNHLSKSFDNYQSMFKFFGMIVGKAIFDGCLLKCTFAKTFLNRLVKKSNQIDDLKDIDEQHYKNLMYVKYYEGDIEDLCLCMSYTDTTFGGEHTVNLIPNGQEIAVTNQNKMQYIMLYANYILNKKEGDQTKAFMEGMHEVIDPELLRMFFPDEIQLLISGGRNEIDIADLRANTVYNGYDQRDSYINNFWEYLESLPNRQREKFLSFVTGSDRPPLLGFKYMNPTLCIARDQAAQGDPKNRYPSAATCMNMLRLPKYKTKEDLKRTMDYVINSNQGFNMG